MSRKFAVLMVVVIVLSSMLSACSDSSSSSSNGTQEVAKTVSDAAQSAGIDMVKDNVVRCFNIASENGSKKAAVEFVESANTGRFTYSFSAFDAECGRAQKWEYFVAWYQDGKLDTTAKK